MPGISTCRAKIRVSHSSLPRSLSAVRRRTDIGIGSKGWIGTGTRWAVIGASRATRHCRRVLTTFRVQGATNRGPWSEPGAAMHIQIDRPVVGNMGISHIGDRCWAWRLQLESMPIACVNCRETLEIRFDERMGERTRIARDLHDTLLQTFHGLLLAVPGGLSTAYPHGPTMPGEDWESR